MNEEMENPSSIQLDVDLPLNNPKLDRLGYAHFAEQIARVIVRMAPKEGIVIGLYGQWGTGKTTVVNFIRSYLNDYPNQEKPVFLEFNPWWFSGRDDLTKRYFAELIAALGKSPGMAKSVVKKISQLADIVSESPLPKAGWAKIISALLKLFTGEKSILEQKAEVIKALLDSPKNILVFIDDIDRLTAEETRVIFQLVKSVGNFPRTIFLLAFDKDIICSALKPMQENPEEYLEKIIQAPYELPIPDQLQLQNILFEKLDTIISEAPEGAFDTNRWGNLYFRGISPFLKTPRNVARFCNALSTTFPAVQNEVNTVDFIAVEGLRVNHPVIYDVIRRNQNLFAGVLGDEPFGTELTDADRNFYDELLKEIDENLRADFKDFLSELFPRLNSVWDNTTYGREFFPEWARELRVCHPDHFATYFRLVVPSNVIPNTEMTAIFGLLSDSEAFETRLKSLADQHVIDGTTRLRVFLNQMENYTENSIELDKIESAVLTIYRVADKLYREEDENKALFDFSGNFISFGRINYQLLKRLDQDHRFRILETGIEASDAVGFIAWEVGKMEQEHEESDRRQLKPIEDREIAPDHLELLKNLALEKFRNMAQKGTLINCPHLPSILARWRDWGGEQELKEWVKGAIATENGLANFLEHFLSKSLSQGISDVQGKINYRLDPKWLESYFNPEEHIHRIEDLSSNDTLTPKQKIAVDIFLKGFQMRKEGKNLNSISLRG